MVGITELHVSALRVTCRSASIAEVYILALEQHNQVISTHLHNYQSKKTQRFENTGTDTLVT